jgi:hypothetical protein
MGQAVAIVVRDALEPHALFLIQVLALFGTMQ